MLITRASGLRTIRLATCSVLGFRLNSGAARSPTISLLFTKINVATGRPRSVKGECLYIYSLTIYTSGVLVCTIRVWYNNPYHTCMVIPYVYTHMVCTIRVWYKYVCGTEHSQQLYIHFFNCSCKRQRLHKLPTYSIMW